MKLNKHKTEWQDPEQFKKPCCITDAAGNFYHPVPNAEHKCGQMMGLMPMKKPHIFRSKAMALHAIHHTWEALKRDGIEFDHRDYIVQEVAK